MNIRMSIPKCNFQMVSLACIFFRKNLTKGKILHMKKENKDMSPCWQDVRITVQNGVISGSESLYHVAEGWRGEKYSSIVKSGIFWLFCSVLSSTLLYLPPLRFHCVGGCWKKPKRLLRLWHWQSETLTSWLDLIHLATLLHLSCIPDV